MAFCNNCIKKTQTAMPVTVTAPSQSLPWPSSPVIPTAYSLSLSLAFSLGKGLVLGWMRKGDLSHVRVGGAISKGFVRAFLMIEERIQRHCKPNRVGFPINPSQKRRLLQWRRFCSRRSARMRWRSCQSLFVFVGLPMVIQRRCCRRRGRQESNSLLTIDKYSF